MSRSRGNKNTETVRHSQYRSDHRGAAMDFFDNRYYRINKAFLSFVGLWPFQTGATKIITRTFGMSGVLGFFVPQVLYLIKFASDTDKLFTSMPVFVGAILILGKTFSILHKFAEFKALLIRIHNDWQSVTAGPEEWILQKYAAAGRKYTVFYLLLLFMSMSVMLLWPIARPILDIILPLNESRARILPHVAEYLIDEEKYYYAILIHEYVSYLACIPIVFGSDVLYLVCMEHVCGMFAILSHRLEKSVPQIFEHPKHPELNSLSDKYFRDHLIGCIRLHAKTIMLVELMASVFTTPLFVDITLGVITHCAACVMIVLRLNQPSEAGAFGAIAFNQSIRLFFICLPGQKLMDHSMEIAKAAYNMKWFKMSTKTRKLLILLMMRSQTACMFLVAKFYVVNLNSFAVVMKMSLSYCTVMASIHDASYVVED